MCSKKLLIQKMEMELEDWLASLMKNAKSRSRVLETNAYEFSIKNEIIYYARCCMFSEEFLEFLNNNENTLQYIWKEFLDDDSVNTQIDINALFTKLALKFKRYR